MEELKNFEKGKVYKIEKKDHKFTITALTDGIRGIITGFTNSLNENHCVGYAGNFNTNAFTLVPVKRINFKLILKR